VLLTGLFFAAVASAGMGKLVQRRIKHGDASNMMLFERFTSLAVSAYAVYIAATAIAGDGDIGPIAWGVLLLALGARFFLVWGMERWHGTADAWVIALFFVLGLVFVVCGITYIVP
jgi:hypothetical protein